MHTCRAKISTSIEWTGRCSAGYALLLLQTNLAPPPTCFPVWTNQKKLERAVFARCSHSVVHSDRSVSPCRQSLFNLFSGFVDTTGVLLATGILLVRLIYRVEYQLLNRLFFFPLSLRRFLKSIRRH